MTKRILLYVLVAVLGFCFASLARADSAIRQYRSSYSTVWTNSIAAACQTQVDYMKSDVAANETYSGLKGFDGVCTQVEREPATITYTCARPGPYPKCSAGQVIPTTVYFYSRMSCSDGSAPDTSKPADQQCAPPQPACKAGQTGEGSWPVGETASGAPITSPMVSGGCVNSCVVDMTEVHSCWGPASGAKGEDFCNYTYQLTGKSCGAGSGPAPSTGSSGGKRKDVPPFTPSKGSCPAGTVQGGVSVDGMPVCIGTGSDPKNSPPPAPKVESEKTTQNPDGSTTTTKTTTTTNSDGSTTTTITNTTTAPDGTTSTDTKKETTDKPSGGAGKDDSNRDDDKYDLCKQNPQLTICRNSSVSGACEQIACDGDAIQCATLRAAATMECRQKQEKEDLLKRPELGIGQQILDGNDPMKAAVDSALKGEEVDFGATSLDQSGFLGVGSCLAPRSFAAFGQTITVNFESMCSNIQPLRYAVMACAFILAYLIVSRAALEA